MYIFLAYLGYRLAFSSVCAKVSTYVEQYLKPNGTIRISFARYFFIVVFLSGLAVSTVVFVNLLCCDIVTLRAHDERSTSARRALVEPARRASFIV